MQTIHNFLIFIKAAIASGLFLILILLLHNLVEKYSKGFTHFQTTLDGPKYLDSPTFVLCMNPKKKIHSKQWKYTVRLKSDKKCNLGKPYYLSPGLKLTLFQHI